MGGAPVVAMTLADVLNFHALVEFDGPRVVLWELQPKEMLAMAEIAIVQPDSCRQRELVAEVRRGIGVRDPLLRCTRAAYEGALDRIHERGEWRREWECPREALSWLCREIDS